MDTAISTEQAHSAIACDLSQIPADRLAQHEVRAKYLFGPGAQDRLELTDGYAYQFNSQDFETIAEFVAHERLCCPFFKFTLEVEPGSGPIRLSITGPEGAKELLAATLSENGIS